MFLSFFPPLFGLKFGQTYFKNRALSTAQVFKVCLAIFHHYAWETKGDFKILDNYFLKFWEKFLFTFHYVRVISCFFMLHCCDTIHSFQKLEK